MRLCSHTKSSQVRADNEDHASGLKIGCANKIDPKEREYNTEESICIKGCKIILRYSETPTERVMDNMGKILCGQKYAPEICGKS